VGTTGRARLEGLQPEGVGAVIVGHLRCAHPARAAQRLELAEGSIEGVGVGAARTEQIELIVSQ
jgi:hypothetical protein